MYSSPDNSHYLRVNYAIINPVSRKRVSGGLTTYQEFRSIFGDIFSVESVEPIEMENAEMSAEK